MEVNDIIKLIFTLVVPSIEDMLLLGIDFWKAMVIVANIGKLRLKARGILKDDYEEINVVSSLVFNDLTTEKSDARDDYRQFFLAAWV